MGSCNSLTTKNIVQPSLKGTRAETFLENMAMSPFKDNRTLKANYKKGDIIGIGSCGKVYRCLNLTSGDILAVKTVKLSSDENILKREIVRLKKEIKILKNLSHENIVKYYGIEVNESEQEVDILLEYVAGGSLKGVLNQYGAFEENLVAIYVNQILNALIYLHDNGIIHRDIKGANILIDIDGTIKLTDFSTSKRDIDGLLSKSLKGTPNWMAPEIVLRTGHGPKVDIWSLGCVIIELLTGIPPFYKPNQTLAEIISILSSGQIPAYPIGISKECKIFLDCCLQTNQEKRLRADELIEMPFIKKNCRNYKNYSLRNIEINTRNKTENLQKITSLVSIPLTTKLSETKKMNSQKDFPIFESVKHNSNSKSKKNYDEQIIDTSLAKQMRKEKQEEITETIKFNEQRKRQWEKALTGKY